MQLALESRFVSFVLRIGDAKKIEDDDDDEILVDLTGGNFEPAPPEFGFQWTEEEDDE